MGKRTRKGNNTTKRELWYREEGQEYAQVIAMLGNGKLRAACFDGKERLATIRGKMRRRVYIFVNDIILVGLRDFQDEKCDVIWKYYPEEAKTLKAMGEIPEHTKIDDKQKDPEEGMDTDKLIVKFGEDSDEEEKKEQKAGQKLAKEPLPMPSDEDSDQDESDDTEKKIVEEKAPKKVTHTSDYVPQNVLKKDEDSEDEDESEEEVVDKQADI